MTAPLAFVDVETTGLDPDWHEIWEVGLIVRRDDLDDCEYSWQLPVDLGRADPKALEVGGFHARRSDRLVELATFAREFADFTRGAHLVGAVVSFDAERLRKVLQANGACPEWHYHLVDVEALAAGFIAGCRRAVVDSGSYATFAETLTLHAVEFGAPQTLTLHAVEFGAPQPPWNSSDLSMAVGVDPDAFERHTALGDARWARAIYSAVTTP